MSGQPPSGSSPPEGHDGASESKPKEPVSQALDPSTPQVTIATPSDLTPEDRIRQRAYALWQKAGEPSGRNEEFWEQAKKELNEQA